MKFYLYEWESLGWLQVKEVNLQMTYLLIVWKFVDLLWHKSIYILH